MRMTPEEFHAWSQHLQFSKETEALIAAILLLFRGGFSLLSGFTLGWASRNGQDGTTQVGAKTA